MWKVKIALYLVTIAISLIVRIAIQKDKAHSKIFTGLFLLGVATTIVFLVIQLFTWYLFTIPEILFFALPIVAIFTIENDWRRYTELPAIVCLMLTVISFLICFVIHEKNIKYSDVPEVETKTYTIVYDSEKISENQIYFKGTNEDKTQYYYHYLDGEEIITLTVDSEAMKKVIIKDKEKPYLEEITSTFYKINYNNKPATVSTQYEPKVEKTYKLYVSKEAIEELV